MSRRPLVVVAAALVLGALLDASVGDAPFPGYSALLGLVGTVAVTALSKVAGKLVQRPDASGDDGVPDLEPDLVGDPALRAELLRQLGRSPDASARTGPDGEVRGG